MVSHTAIAEIEKCYQAVSHQCLNPHIYSGELFEVVCEITTADTFIAGLASKILDGSIIEQIERVALDEPLMIDERWWNRSSGERFDISEAGEIREFAKVLERLRTLCIAALSGT